MVVEYGNGKGTIGEVMPIEPVHIVGSYGFVPFRFSIQVYRETLEQFSKQFEIEIEITEHYDPIRFIEIKDRNLEVKIWSY
jgi:hypothetical protein